MKKRILALLLLSVMLLGVFCGCGDEEKDSGKKNETVWLPLGLKFGQSYDSFCKTLTDKGYEAPELKDASANSGYFSKQVQEDEVMFEWDFLGAETLKKLSTSEDALEKMKYGFMFPSWSFSFNDDKELYEMYISFQVLNDADESTFDIVNNTINEIVNHFDAEFESKGTDKAKGEIIAAWAKDDMKASVQVYDAAYSNGTKYRMIMIVLHNHKFATVTKE